MSNSQLIHFLYLEIALPLAGAGYRLVISKLPGCDVEAVTRTLVRHVPKARLESSLGAELTYILPNESVHMFPGIFARLDIDKEELRILNYGLSATTMNEVFVKCVYSIYIYMYICIQQHYLCEFYLTTTSA